MIVALETIGVMVAVRVRPVLGFMPVVTFVVRTNEEMAAATLTTAAGDVLAK